MENVLLVDDDVELCELIREFLQPEGFQVQIVHDGDSGLRAALSGTYALVILDIMLPGMSGLDVLRQIRTSSSIPVLLLTARGAEVDRVIGLELGSDDYLSKPCSPRELLARVRAVLRRTNPDPRRLAPKVRVGDVELDATRRIVTRADHPIELTPIEFNMLEVLLRAAGTVVTRDHLAKTVLGRSFDPFDRSLDVHISKIRKKLTVTAELPEPIQTVRGVGYLYADPAGAAVR